jgi:hypothetical protein
MRGYCAPCVGALLSEVTEMDERGDQRRRRRVREEEKGGMRKEGQNKSTKTSIESYL